MSERESGASGATGDVTGASGATGDVTGASGATGDVGRARSEEVPTTGPIRMPAPQPRFEAGADARDGGPAPGWGDEPGERGPAGSSGAGAVETGVLDRPVDDVPLRDRLARPGMARSTRILLLVLGAVVVFAGGALLGRATAPDTGPGSVPPTVGVVEAVDPAGGQGFPVITVRAADGTQTVLTTTAGTVVAVPQGQGAAGVSVGRQVTVTGERDARGQVIATRIDLPLAGG